MKSMETMTDPTKPKASLGHAKVQMKESTVDRAARYFATHGMMKVGHMLGDELSASAQARIQQEQKQKKAEQNDLVMPDDDDDNTAYRAQWKRVDAIKRRSALRR